MWSKIIFYLAWFFYSVELSSAFFSRPQHQAITNNGASKTGVATTTVTGPQSTESQNIPTTAAVNQQQQLQQKHLPNYFSNQQTANVNQHSAIPSNLHGVPPVQPHPQIADHPQLFHPVSFQPQLFHPPLPLTNFFDHHPHTEVANFHHLNYDHRPFHPQDDILHSNEAHTPRDVNFHSHNANTPQDVIFHSHNGHTPQDVNLHSHNGHTPRDVIFHSHTPKDEISHSHTPQDVISHSHNDNTPRDVIFHSHTPKDEISHSHTPQDVISHSHNYNTPRDVIFHSHTPKDEIFNSHTPKDVIFHSHTPQDVILHSHAARTPHDVIFHSHTPQDVIFHSHTARPQIPPFFPDHSRPILPHPHPLENSILPEQLH